MSDDALKSEAFQRAVLTSESYRSTGLLILLGALTIFVVVRGLATSDFRIVVLQFAFLALIIGQEVIMLRAIKRALRGEAEVASKTWLLNVFLESQIPTVALFLLLGGP